MARNIVKLLNQIAELDPDSFTFKEVISLCECSENTAKEILEMCIEEGSFSENPDGTFKSNL